MYHIPIMNKVDKIAQSHSFWSMSTPNPCDFKGRIQSNDDVQNKAMVPNPAAEAPNGPARTAVTIASRRIPHKRAN